MQETIDGNEKEDVQRGVGSLRLRGLIEENSGEAERAKNAGLQLDLRGSLYLLSLCWAIIQEHGCGAIPVHLRLNEKKSISPAWPR